MFAAEKETDNSLSDDKIVSPDDAIGHEELCTVDDQSGEVTEEEHDDNADKNTSKIHFGLSRTVAVRSHMSVPEYSKCTLEDHISSFIFLTLSL